MKKDKKLYAISTDKETNDYVRPKTNWELEKEINDLTKRIIKLENRTIN